MNRLLSCTLAAAVLALPLLPAAATAAESYDNCVGTVPSLPAVLATQGVWCLKKDLATSVASGNAITVSAPNVTLDCNGFKLGGLAAGTATEAIGVNASGTSNLTVRGCNIRGFKIGVYADTSGGGGHLIEDNRFDGNTVFGISVFGDGTMVRRNQVMDTGFGTGAAVARIAGIHVDGNGDVRDNTVRLVDGTTQSSAYVYGVIVTNADAGSITGNQVSGVVSAPVAADYGLRPWNSNGVSVRDNDVVTSQGDFGIYCSAGYLSVARDNTTKDAGTPLGYCIDGGGNVVY